MTPPSLSRSVKEIGRLIANAQWNHAPFPRGGAAGGRPAPRERGAFAVRRFSHSVLFTGRDKLGGVLE